MKIEDGETFYWRTENPHWNNTETMMDFLVYELGENTGWDLDYVNESYAEIVADDDGRRIAVHASGDGDSFNHKVEFELIG